MTALAKLPPAHRVYENMLKSNLQPEEKHVLREWAERMVGPLETLSKVRIQDAPGGLLSVARQTTEGFGMAALLAYLQVNVNGGLDVRGVPLDGAGGFVLSLASAFMGHSELGTDARNLGQDATLICAYRKLVDGFSRARVRNGRELYAHLQPGAKPPGHPANDPVAAAGADL